MFCKYDIKNKYFTFVKYYIQICKKDNQCMKIFIIALVTIIVSTGGTFYLSAYSESGQSMMTHNMGGMMDMCKSMMSMMKNHMDIGIIAK